MTPRRRFTAEFKAKVNDADISRRDRLSMRIGDHRQECRDKGQGDERDESAFDPEPAPGPTAIIGRAPMP